MFKIGCAEKKLEVPLFVELYGYGPYAARRNKGTSEPLYCRAFTFNNGEKRAMIIYSDLCVTDDQYARELRAVISSHLRMDPQGIAFVATHTHSGPSVCAESPDTSGIRNAPFQDHWKRCVLEVAEEAYLHEEEIASADAGKAPLKQPIGTNRVEPERNITDPTIRWMRFKRPDGSVKLMIHNHGAHGIADNSPALDVMTSSDWMGAANRIIREENMADFALFLQGAAGDINTRTSCLQEKRDGVGYELGKEYVGYIKDDLANAVPVDLSKIAFALRTFEFPTVRQTPDELRHDAEAFRAKGVTEKEKEYWNINGCRLEEMALLVEKGYDLGVWHDLQVIQVGDAEFFFVPGEYYVESGMELMEGAQSPFPFVGTVSNGNGTYIFSEKSALRFPTPFTKTDKLYGYYEIYGYMHKLRFKFQNNIAAFVIEKLRELEKMK